MKDFYQVNNVLENIGFIREIIELLKTGGRYELPGV